MIEEKIPYIDFDGNPAEATFNFGLSKVELIELELDDGTNSSMSERLERLTKEKNEREIFKQFQEIVLMAVGRREGQHFVKSPEIVKDLTATNAFDELVMKMLGDAGWAAKFITNMLPKDMAEKMEQNAETPSAEKLLTMSDKQFYKAVGRDRKRWSKEVTAVANQRRRDKHAA